MAELLAPNGLRIRVRLRSDAFTGEEAQFSWYTGMRAESNWQALTDETHDLVQGLIDIESGGLSDRTEEVTVFLDEWQNPIFSADSWGNRFEDNRLILPGNDTPMPPQIAVVLSVETNDPEIPTKRRKNRSFLGHIPVTATDSNGRLGATRRAEYADAFNVYSNNLEAIPLDSGVELDLGGMCTVSYRGTGTGGLESAQISPATLLRVGNVFDTQRRRRRSLTETYTERVLGPGGVPPAQGVIKKRL